MIIEDEWGEDLEEIADSRDFNISELRHNNNVFSSIQFIEARQQVRNEEAHRNLKNDLVEHLWNVKHGKFT